MRSLVGHGVKRLDDGTFVLTFDPQLAIDEAKRKLSYVKQTYPHAVEMHRVVLEETDEIIRECEALLS